MGNMDLGNMNLGNMNLGNMNMNGMSGNMGPNGSFQVQYRNNISDLDLPNVLNQALGSFG